MAMMVSLIGAGPGDPGLLTLKGKEILSIADVIVYDALAFPGLLDYAKPDAEVIYVGKIADQHAMPQREINELLATKASQGKHVVRLKGGDPYIFGRGGEEGEFLLERGIPYEEIPGISSAIAAPAYAGIPVTHRNFSSSVSIITGHENPEKGASVHDWQAFARSGSTLIFVMGMRNLANICNNLINNGLNPDTPAAIIYRGTTPFQKTLISTVAKLPAEAEEKNFSNPSVIVIGKVVQLHDKLAWFEKKPLLGRTVVVTRAREQASEMAQMLEALGANVLQCPTIKIKPLDDYSQLDAAISNLNIYAWVIFTSVNGVKFFWQRLAACGKDSRALFGVKVAAIGPATAQELASRGICADLIPDSYVAESVAEALLAQENLKDKSVLIPRASVARSYLPEVLTRAGANVEVAPAYITEAADVGVEELKHLLAEGKIDCISFGSSSTVKNFFNIFSLAETAKLPNIALAAIGPITAKALKQYGLKATIEPERYTIPALVKAIAKHFSNHN